MILYFVFGSSVLGHSKLVQCSVVPLFSVVALIEILHFVSDSQDHLIPLSCKNLADPSLGFDPYVTACCPSKTICKNEPVGYTNSQVNSSVSFTLLTTVVLEGSLTMAAQKNVKVDL